MDIWELRIYDIRGVSWYLEESFLFGEKPSKEEMYSSLLNYLIDFYDYDKGKPFRLNVSGPSVIVSYLEEKNRYMIRLTKTKINFEKPLRLDSLLTHSNASIRNAVKKFKGGLSSFSPDETEP